MSYEIIFYPAGEESNVVIDFYRKLPLSVRKKILRQLSYLEEYGLRPEVLNIKKLKGYGF